MKNCILPLKEFNYGRILLNLPDLLNSENGRQLELQKNMNSENPRDLRKNSKFANKF